MAVAANREPGPKETEVVGRMVVTGIHSSKFRIDLRTIELLSSKRTHRHGYIWRGRKEKTKEKENLGLNPEKYQYLMVT